MLTDLMVLWLTYHMIICTWNFCSLEVLDISVKPLYKSWTTSIFYFNTYLRNTQVPRSFCHDTLCK